MIFKKLAHVIMEPGKSKICKVDPQPRDPGREGVAVYVQKPSVGKIPSCLRDVGPLFYSDLQVIALSSFTL